MLEKHFEDILQRYPEMIEEGLVLSGRQVNVGGKYVDLLFEDRFGHKLIVELKKGVIKREHIAQLLDYEGHFVSESNPDVRVMLIGNRVPTNLRNSLDHHGFEWKEISVSKLIAYLENKKDDYLLGHFSEEEHRVEIVTKIGIAPKEIEKQNNISKEISEIKERRSTNRIKKDTNTVYRQCDHELNGSGVSYMLSGSSWADENATKYAVVFLSCKSNYLVVIPSVIVDKYIFNPYFEKSISGYALKEEFKRLDIDNKNGLGRIDLVFIVEQERLHVSIKPPGRSKQMIPLMSLPKQYWRDVNLNVIDPVTCLVEIINIRCKELSSGEGILPIKM